MSFVFYCEVFALGCSFFLLHPIYNSKLRLLILILLLTVITELVGHYYRVVLFTSNHHLYNISVPLIITLFLTLLKNDLSNQKAKSFIGYGIPVFLSLALVNVLWIQGFQKFATFNYVIGALVLTSACVYYFIEFIRRPVQVSVRKEPVFWIAVALLALYLPKATVYTAFEYLAYNNAVNESFGQIRIVINNIFSIIFYLLISYASVCRLI